MDYTPPADVAGGEVVVVGEIVGVAPVAIPAGNFGALALHGVFAMPKATGGGTAIPAGTRVYWDSMNKIVVTGGNDFRQVGYTVAAAADADDQVDVKLERGAPLPAA
jgi:predicted RecA/RadA family phage recombinase